tara:strand:+ start:113 stop:496 length:384 start_codon:yes stop_codon:yes gene_type:complete
MDTNEIVKIYVKIRDKKDEVKRKLGEQVALLDADLKVIEEELQERLKAAGATSVKTPNGTVYSTIKSKVWTDNWDSFYKFIEARGLFDLLERRIHQSNIKSFLDDNPDDIPEGLNIESIKTVTVRRK